MAERLNDTVALVTRASSGIGEQGGTKLVLESNITHEQQGTDAVERTVAELGRLDTLVNNAGVMLLGPAVGAPLSEWQRMVELNVLGFLYCAHAALPHLLRAAEDSPRRVADMVNISSTAGRIAEQALQEQQRPVLVHARLDDPVQKSCLPTVTGSEQRAARP